LREPEISYFKYFLAMKFSELFMRISTGMHKNNQKGRKKAL
jgi:hypothetical protein